MFLSQSPVLQEKSPRPCVMPDKHVGRKSSFCGIRNLPEALTMILSISITDSLKPGPSSCPQPTAPGQRVLRFTVGRLWPAMAAGFAAAEACRGTGDGGCPMENMAKWVQQEQ